MLTGPLDWLADWRYMLEIKEQMEKAMSSTDTLRSEFKQFLLSWLELHIPGFSEIIFNGIVVLWIALLALTLHLFLQIFLRRLLVRNMPARCQVVPLRYTSHCMR